ncbi:MAG: LexA family protein [Pseudomonadota bacterium]
MATHGGARPGAGRPRQLGGPGEPTKVVRLPASRVDEVRRYLRATAARWPDSLVPLGAPALAPVAQALPLFASRVPAGFPSPAEDYAEGRLDLNEYLVEHEAATFYVRVKGHSMTGAGILDGDVIAVDRALEPRHGDIVLAVIDGELTVKELHAQQGRVRLLPHSPDFAPIEIREGQEFTLWGVVKGVVRKLR